MILKILPLISAITVIALINFVTQRTRVLIALLSLEAATLSLALLATLSLSINQRLFACIVILAIGAAEASLALALLALIAQSFGRDIVKTVSINKC